MIDVQPFPVEEIVQQTFTRGSVPGSIRGGQWNSHRHSSMKRRAHLSPMQVHFANVAIGMAGAHLQNGEEFLPRRHGVTEARLDAEGASVTPCFRGKSP